MRMDGTKQGHEGNNEFKRSSANVLLSLYFYLPTPFFSFPSNDTFFYKTYLGLPAFAFS